MYQNIREELGVEEVNSIISIYRRRCYQHLQRMTADRLTKEALEYRLGGRRQWATQH